MNNKKRERFEAYSCFPFTYTGQSRIPRDVTHLTIQHYEGLANDEDYFERLANDEDSDDCYEDFGSHVSITSRLFLNHCHNLREIVLTEGMREIGYQAFSGCCSLVSIHIPSTVLSIDHEAFKDCFALEDIELNEGLNYIGCRSFMDCSNLESLMIPSTVRCIEPNAFNQCTPLELYFVDSMETIVSEASLREWWSDDDDNGGCKEAFLLLYNSLVQFRMPSRMGMIQSDKWKEHFFVMLTQILFDISPEDGCHIDRDFINDIRSYVESIDCKLSEYENCIEGTSLLELALWKSKMMEHLYNTTDDDHTRDVRVQHRTNCGATVIIPLVLAFLVTEPEKEGPNDGGGEDDAKVVFLDVDI